MQEAELRRSSDRFHFSGMSMAMRHTALATLRLAAPNMPRAQLAGVVRNATKALLGDAADRRNRQPTSSPAPVLSRALLAPGAASDWWTATQLLELYAEVASRSIASGCAVASAVGLAERPAEPSPRATGTGESYLGSGEWAATAEAPSTTADTFPGELAALLTSFEPAGGAVGSDKFIAVEAIKASAQSAEAGMPGRDAGGTAGAAKAAGAAAADGASASFSALPPLCSCRGLTSAALAAADNDWRTERRYRPIAVQNKRPQPEPEADEEMDTEVRGKVRRRGDGAADAQGAGGARAPSALAASDGGSDTCAATAASASAASESVRMAAKETTAAAGGTAMVPPPHVLPAPAPALPPAVSAAVDAARISLGMAPSASPDGATAAAATAATAAPTAAVSTMPSVSSALATAAVTAALLAACDTAGAAATGGSDVLQEVCRRLAAGVRGRDDGFVLAVVRRFMRPALSLKQCCTVVASILLPRARAMRTQATRAFVDAAAAAAAERPEAVVESLLLPLLLPDGGAVGTVQGEIVTRLVKQSLPPASLELLLTRLSAPPEPSGGGGGGGGGGSDGGDGGGRNWNDELMGVVAAVLAAKPPLSAETVAALAERLEVTAEAVGTASPKLAAVVRALAIGYGPQVRPHCEVLLKAVSRSSATMARTAAAVLKRLEG